MSPSETTARVVQTATWVVVVSLMLRFVMQAFNADATNRLVDWIYDNTSSLVAPFFNWFPAGRAGDGFNIEFATLIALASYAFVGFVALSVVGNYRAKANGVAAKRRFNISFNR